VGYDTNGNKVVKVMFPNQKAFSIQTIGNLPKTSSIVRGIKKLNEIDEKDYSVIESEVIDYITEYGSSSQKQSLKVYKKMAKGGSTNPEIETKKASLAKIMKVRDGANSSEMAKAQAVKVIEKLEKEIAELEASNVAPAATKPQRKAVAKKKPTPKAPEKKIKDIDLAVAKSVEPKGGVAKRVDATVAKPKFKVGDVVMFEDGTLEMKIDSFKKGYKGAFIYSGHFVSKPSEKFVEAEKDLVLAKKPKRTKKVITSTKRKKAAATETPKRKKKVITSAKRKKAAMVDVPTTKRGLAADKKREALPVGKRVSAAGNTYYEYRRNRADRNAKRKFAEGGETKIPMNNLDWGKSTDERNSNLDKYDSLKSESEKAEFLKELKRKNESTKMASGGEVEKSKSLRYFILNEASSGMIANKTPYSDYKTIDAIRYKAVQILNRDGDREYTMKSFSELIQEAVLEHQEEKMANGGGVGEIDMVEVEKAAKHYTDKSKWSTPPTITRFESDIAKNKELRRKLDNKQITPSKVIGTGYKPNLARPLAYKWIDKQILIAEKAIELLKESGEKMAKGGEVDLTRGEIEDKIAGLRLRISKTKKQISGYETTNRGKYNKLFQEKVVPLQEEMARLSELYGKSIY
jgi:hypothetical protein